MNEATVVLETYEGDVIVPVRHCSCFDACRHAHIARGHNGRVANVKCVSPRYEKHWQLPIKANCFWHEREAQEDGHGGEAHGPE